MEDYLQFEIDWTLDQAQFRTRIRKMVKLSTDGGKVLPLPFFPDDGNSAIELLTAILAQVNCDRCNAPCCKFNPQGDDLSLLPSEYQKLKAKYGDEHLRAQGEQYFIKMPCGFLRSDNLCSIYPDRPLVCVLYPLNPGGGEVRTGRTAISLESRCPEARRLTKVIYMMSWRIRQIYFAAGAEDFTRAFAGK